MMINLVPKCQAIMIITSSKHINPAVTINPQGRIGVLVCCWGNREATSQWNTDWCHGDITTPIQTSWKEMQMEWSRHQRKNRTRLQTDLCCRQILICVLVLVWGHKSFKNINAAAAQCPVITQTRFHLRSSSPRNHNYLSSSAPTLHSVSRNFKNGKLIFGIGVNQFGLAGQKSGEKYRWS